jgi:hypothetical protein
VVAFKEKPQLRLPAGFTPQLIESETPLLELAYILIKSGYLCRKKHGSQSEFLHCDLILLEYDNVEESRRHKHLGDARQVKEQEGSNPNKAVKGNPFVFTHLALLYNLYYSAKLDW